MTNDPAYRFTVVYKDGREMSQEDENRQVVRDHAHIEDWDNVVIYALVNRPGDHVVTVNFETGDFSIDGHIIKMMDTEADMFFGIKKDIKFKPVYGRRNFMGEFGAKVFFYLGWTTAISNKKIKRVMYIGEDGTTFFEAI